MRKTIAIILIIVIAALGGAWYWTGKRLFIPILNYHRVDNTNNSMTVQPAEFEKQLQYLQEQGYTSITLDEVASYLHGEGELPAKPIVITFDDGYEDNQRVAVPLLRKYGFKAIIFVVSDYVGKPGYLTWEKMRAVQERAISIGSHTMNHEKLTTVDEQELAEQLRNSKTSLEKGLGTSVDYIAYPYGPFNARVIAATQAAGYKGACGSKPGVNMKGDDMYALRRVYVDHSWLGLWDFKLRLYRARLLSVFY
jgi:peptidoglycan/xylan/chitin deacetylase (PgdA/CDA1 family)